MSTIVGIDPGLRSPGVAVVRDGTLVAVANVRIPAEVHKIDDIGQRLDVVAQLIARWLRTEAYNAIGEVVGGLHYEGDVLVYEYPQIYGVGVSKCDPNKLIQLAAIGAAVARDMHACRIMAPTPREWCGGTKKATRGDPWNSTRGAKLRARLRPEEFAVIPAQHDAIDAVGLALHASDRPLSVPIRVRPGAARAR